MKLAYYPGCSLDGSAVEYGLSTERVARILGVELKEIDDWNCCGATAGHNTDKLLSLALPARNLALAEKEGLDVLAPCAACYNRFKATEHAVREDAGLKARIEYIIDMSYSASNNTISVLEWIKRLGIDNLKAKVTNSLKGMKAACYYGCLLVRPSSHTGFDDPENPQSMDEIIKALGAETVDWAYKTECCGAALATSRPEIGGKMIYEILQNVKEAGAECIVTACPLCMMNLDMRQGQVEKRFSQGFNIPVYYVTELVAVACGDDPKTVGIHKHFVEAVSYLKGLPAKAKAMEEEEAKAKPAAKTKRAEGEKPSDNSEDIQKKIDAILKGLEKNPEKVVSKLIEDGEKVNILADVIKNDEKKRVKLAEVMAQDKEKAIKVAEALIVGEMKKREKSSN
ncbi:CoB--CoM heterodisulfide reductase iron-sulfur subunit B family protein [Thermosyntropha sp.]|uniref:CoB--CoM heterodisulfide reductase iron-sulfur subunit B family protein n=1 Tax=Thermosyntropha sp. TaxID=2740820 RepID=UPI0025E1FCA1|nr:CoB--CoM heterodisulfide reductase iron-sulfur subunit B family protein [Thermosyntropha sp.]MBO8159859.1 CoB--CoM heterodisulfide reductase iron-sulfur subunit B family protein [Thermosyntropha sp.]